MGVGAWHWFIYGTAFALLALVCLFQMLRAWQHYYGGRAKCELYLPNHIPITRWRRVVVYAAPYLACTLALLLAGYLGWEAISTIQQSGNERTHDLPLTFRTSSTGNGQSAIAFQPTVLTNQSEHKMNLSFILVLKNKDQSLHRSLNGAWHAWGNRGDWHETLGEDVLTLGSESTEKGILVFSLPPTPIANLHTWEPELLSLEIHDRVSGVRVLCNPVIGYPPSIESPWPTIGSPTD